METQQAPSGVAYVVRAMPAVGHERRWCTGRPFTKQPIEVFVVDEPRPHVRVAGDASKIAAYSYEIAPSELAELKRDRHLAVSLKADHVEGNPDEVNALKAQIAEKDKTIAQLRREFAEAAESIASMKAGAEETAAAFGKKLEAANNEIESLKQNLATAQFGEPKKRR